MGPKDLDSKEMDNSRALRARAARGGPNRPLLGAREDSGFALILTLGIMMALMLGSLVAVQYVTGYLPVAAADQDRQAALAAAQAGVDDYLNRLNQDSNYWQDGSDASNVAMKTDPWGWVPVDPGSSAYFHYSVDVSDMEAYEENDSTSGSWGTLYVTSTGKVGNVTRTIQVGVRQSDFLSNLYLSNYNLVDPDIEAAAGLMSQSAADACTLHAWDKNPSGGYGPNVTNCYSMFNYWISGNDANGPVQSNDDYYLCGTPKFDYSISTADPNNGTSGTPNDSPYWIDHAGCSDDPSFGGDGKIDVVPYVFFPASPTFIEGYASATPSAQLGCLYYGPTAIDFSGQHMYVYSPDTPSSNTNCLGTGPTPWAQALPLPADGVIYVANLPVPGPRCLVNTPSWAEFAGSNCAGDAFVVGTPTGASSEPGTGLVDGQVTVAADDNIYLVAPAVGASVPNTVDNTTIGYQSNAGGDVLGLAANNYMIVNHDVASGGADTFGPWRFANVVNNPTLDAVLFSVNRSLDTGYFWEGSPMGNMTINGAVVSEFMDTEGEFSGGGGLVHGYNEQYNWDSRLAHLTPPYFIPPSDNHWGEVSYSELPAQDG